MVSRSLLTSALVIALASPLPAADVAPAAFSIAGGSLLLEPPEGFEHITDAQLGGIRYHRRQVPRAEIAVLSLN